MRILAFGAHPDDIEIFMGGAVAAWAAMGAELHFAVATDGAAGGTGDPAALARTRAAEAEAGAALFGARLALLGRPDGALARDPGAGEAVHSAVRAVRPDLIVTHAPNDYHADHRALSALVLSAAGFAAPVLYCDTYMGVGFQPTHYVDIAAHAALKARAILCHASQSPDRFVTLAERQNRFRGGQCGDAEGLAEAYRHEPIYPFADIRALLPPAPGVRPVPHPAERR